MKKWKSNLDEMQEQKLLQIESRGFWLAFWGLLAAMVVQQFFYGWDMEHMAGEWMVLMVIAIYVSGECARNGIWSRTLKPNAKTNLVVSLIAGLTVGAVVFANVYAHNRHRPYGSLAAGIFVMVGVFALCFLVLTVSARYTKRRQAKLEEEPEDEE